MSNDVRGVLGTNLRQLRRFLGMTQKELSEKAGISLTSLSVYERGGAKPSVVSIANLADAMGVPLEYLLQPHTEPIEILMRKDVLEAAMEAARKGPEGTVAASDASQDYGYGPRMEYDSMSSSYYGSRPAVPPAFAQYNKLSEENRRFVDKMIGALLCYDAVREVQRKPY